MILSIEALREKAAMYLMKNLQKYIFALEKASQLEELLHDVFVVLTPKPSDYHDRRGLVRVFNLLTMEIYGNYGCSQDVPHVVEFGSFTMDMFLSESDLDLSLNFCNIDISRKMKIHTLDKLKKKLSLLQRSKHVYGVKLIRTAKVPVLKVIDRGTQIECDISVGNMDGIMKSKILYFISLIDERFRKLCFLMKAWAKAHTINSAKDGTLNSLTIILLVAYHLQTRNHPILPPFSAIFRDGCDVEAVQKSIPKFANYGQKNKESVAELFLTLLIMLSSVQELWSEGLCVSAYDGSWISKTWGDKVGCISVEDFSDRSQNVARAVAVREMKKIYNCINLSIQNICDFLNCRMDGNALRQFLFGKDVNKSVGEARKKQNMRAPISNITPASSTLIEDKDTTEAQKETEPQKHSENRSSHCGTTLGKSMRTDGSSQPCTRLPEKQVINGQIGPQKPLSYDTIKPKPVVNHGVVPLVGPGGTQHNWSVAQATLPVDPTYRKRMRHTGTFMDYRETNRVPYVPTPIAHRPYPTISSNIGSSISSGYVRDSNIATPFVTPVGYPNYPPAQLHNTFRAPNPPNFSVNPTFPPRVNHIFPSHSSETYRVGHFQPTSNVSGYPHPPFPQQNFPSHEPRPRFR